MSKVWVTADLHLGHANICKFTRKDGSPLRPWDDVQEMDEEMVRRWNEIIHPDDRVYVLGDVVINRKALPTLGRLMGRKCLIKGNHDIFRLEDYAPYFDDVRAYAVRKFGERKVIMSHIPVHPDSVGRFGINIHGHLHSDIIQDPRYKCVSVEHTDYRPVEIEGLLKSIPEIRA